MNIKQKTVYPYLPIVGFNNYEISQSGVIINRKTKKEIKHAINFMGYHRACLKKNKKTFFKRIHRLVYNTFCGEIGKGLHVNHIDGNKDNNNLDNLNLCTHLENMAHAKANNLTRVGRNKTKSSLELRNKIFKERKKGVTIKELSNKYNFTQRSIYRILSYYK